MIEQLTFPFVDKGAARKGGFILLYPSNLAFWPLDPREEEILIEDIAHSLSMICRYCGHVSNFLSVAEHSINVSYHCSNPLKGLLHDGSEAYLSDIPAPVKKQAQLAGYREVEHNIQSMIYNKFCGDAIEPEDLGWADIQVRYVEKDLLKPANVLWKVDPEIKVQLHCWEPKKAEEMFLKRWKEVKNG